MDLDPLSDTPESLSLFYIFCGGGWWFWAKLQSYKLVIPFSSSAPYPNSYGVQYLFLSQPSIVTPHVAVFYDYCCNEQCGTPICCVPHQLYNRESTNTRADHTVFLMWFLDSCASLSCQCASVYLRSDFLTELLWHHIYFCSVSLRALCFGIVPPWVVPPDWHLKMLSWWVWLRLMWRHWQDYSMSQPCVLPPHGAHL